MARITGIGGVFFKCKDPEALQVWYREKLGFELEEYGGQTFHWRNDPKKPEEQYTVWSPFKAQTEYFDPSDKEFMINFRVDDLGSFVSLLKSRGIELIGGIDEEPYGRFAWIMDPEGTKVELWEPLGSGG